MYNESQKMEFLSDIEATITYTKLAKVTYTNSEFFESKYNKDIINFSEEEFKETVSEIVSTNAKNLLDTVRLLKKYVEWGMSNGIECNRSLLNVEPLTIKNKSVMSRMFTSPVHLKVVLDSLYPEADLGTTDTIRRAFFWLAFSGIDEDDASNLTADNFDFNNMTIKVRNKKYEIYREALKDFKFICESDTLLYIHNEPHYETIKNRVPGKEVLRTSKKRFPAAAIKLMTSNTVSPQGYRVTYNSVLMSGDFYRIYMRELSGLEPNFVHLAERDIERGNKSHTELQYRKILYSLVYAYKINYTQWKYNLIG